jgi:hypothetical protein
MLSVQFWKTWPAVYQRLLLAISLVFLAALLVALYSFVRNPAPVFTWQQLQELRQEEIPVYAFDVGGFELTVSTDNYILFDRWAGNPMQLNPMATDVYLVFFAISLCLLLAIVTTLPRFWFFVGSGIAVFMISSFQLETLLIGGLENKIPAIILMILLLGIGLFYQFISKAASFLNRTAAFLATIIVVGVILINFSGVAQPLRYFATNTLPAAVVLFLIFVVMVAHEIMASFVTLVGRGTKNASSLRHYLFISGFYLINLWMAYWTRIGWIDWGFNIYPVVLLAVSGVLAIWGIRQRQPQYENIVSADPFAVYFIMGMGTVAFSTYGYFFATANDAALLMLNDLTLYAHIGYGMIFLAYVASNFLGMLGRNYPVYKVLYKPTAMPYFSFRLAGLIFTLAFIFYNSWMVPVNHMISGYYTSLGDLFSAEQNSTLPLGYYKRAFVYAPYNQHAATALAKIEAFRGNAKKEREYTESANKFRPTEFTLLNEANAYRELGNSLEEIFKLQSARRQQPKSGVIRNNLGLVYERLGVTDSAYIYFSQTRSDPQTRASGEMNLLGWMAVNNFGVNPDSVYQLVQSEEPRVKGNALAFANRKGRMIETTLELPRDSILDIFIATQIGNYLTNHLTKTDTGFLRKCINLALKKENENVREIVLVPASKACYASGQVNRAFQLLENIIFQGGNQGKHNTTLALWSLDQGKPDVALSYLQFANNQTSSHTALTNALTLAEAGRINESIVAWDTLSHPKDSLTRLMTESMKRVLAAPENWFKDLSEKEKYQYLHYRVALEDSVQFERLIRQINNEDFRAKAILDRSRKWFAQDETGRAARVFSKLQGLHLTDNRLFAEIKYFELHLFAARRQWPFLQEQVDKGILFGPYREADRVYYTALQQADAGDTLKAGKNFEWLARNNSYFDEGVVAAAQFFQRHGADKRKPYRILSGALQANPFSVRVLKAYIPVALNSGYDVYAASALQTLQSQMSTAAFRRYIIENRLSNVPLQ